MQSMKEEWMKWLKSFQWKWEHLLTFLNHHRLQSGTSAIEDFLNQLRKFEFEEQLDDSDNQLIYEPKGVCALITPWNWPISQVALKVIPQLLLAALWF